MPGNEIPIVVRTEDKSDAGLKSVEAKAGKFSGTMGKIGQVAGGVLSAGFVQSAGTAIIGFFGDMVSEAREAEKVSHSTAQGIKTMGAESWTSADKIAKLSGEISNQIGVDDELIQQSANLLLTFGNVKNAAGEGADIFDRATRAAQDLSAKGFGDSAGAAKMLGKALNDPIKGITAMSRAGVTFTEQQKEQIKTMVESGDILGAQKIIMGEVEKQVGGTAAATATAGDKMAVAFANFKETMGTALLPILDKVFAALSKLAVWASENPKTFIAIAAVISTVLVAAFVAWSIAAAQAAAATLAATWPILAIGAAIAALIAGIWLLIQHWDKVGQAATWVWNNIIKPVIEAAVQFILNTPFGLLIRGIIWLIQNWDKLKEGIKAAMERAKQIVGSIVDWLIGKWNGFVNFLMGIGGRIMDFGSTMWNGIVSGARMAVNVVVDAINGIIMGINALISAYNRIPAAPNVGMIPHVPHASFATGGFSRGGFAVVGEQGRELVRLPMGSRVFPHGASERMMSEVRQRMQPVVLELKTSGGMIEEFLAEIIRRYVNIQGGDVQQVFGR
jgi:hypothetical protein